MVQLITETNLYALEIDVSAALDDFKQQMGSLDSGSLAESLGIPKNMIDSLGLQDIADLFVNPPPGIDEIVGN